MNPEFLVRLAQTYDILSIVIGFSCFLTVLHIIVCVYVLRDQTNRVTYGLAVFSVILLPALLVACFCMLSQNATPEFIRAMRDQPGTEVSALKTELHTRAPLSVRQVLYYTDIPHSNYAASAQKRLKVKAVADAQKQALE